jgi:hypothetical protein
LQQRKTALLKPAPISGQPRKAFARKTSIDQPTPEELKAFHIIREHVKELMFLYHFVEDRQMYVNIDACKAGFSAYAYYLRDDASTDEQKQGTGLS